MVLFRDGAAAERDRVVTAPVFSVHGKADAGRLLVNTSRCVYRVQLGEPHHHPLRSAEGRRGFRRFAFQSRVRIDDGSGSAAIGVSVDLSASGVRFRTTRPLATGAHLEVAMSTPDGGDYTTHFCGRVVRTGECHGDWELPHEVAVVFDEPWRVEE